MPSRCLHPLFFSKRVRFDRAAEFLAACACGDTEEAQMMLVEARETKKNNEEDVPEIINCSNADGITALHQVRQSVFLRFHWNDWLMDKKLIYSCIILSLVYFPLCKGLHRWQHGDGVLSFGAWCQCEPGWQWGMDTPACCCLLRLPWNCEVSSICLYS